MLPFRQVDVFSSHRLRGNPVAVVHDADAVSDAEMAALARWTNLSETTFLLSPDDPAADYRLRIFTPGGELPFAGHPTLGSAHAWLEHGGVPVGEHVVQQCGAGMVAIRRSPDGLAFAAPPLLRSGPVAADDLARVVAALGITLDDVVDAAWTDNGPGWVSVLLTDAAAVLALQPRFAEFGELMIGAVGPHPPGGDADVEVRAFAPSAGVAEDPVTGSLNAALGQWFAGDRLPASYVAAQGTALDRDGRVQIEVDDEGTVWVGGDVTTVVTGEIELA